MLASSIPLLAAIIPLVSSSLHQKPLQHDAELTVDLGYQVNQGRIVNGSLVTFRNVRFAAPPIGDLRFKGPRLPSVDPTQTPINSSDVICPQAYPKWLTMGAVTPFTPADIPPVDPRTSEDCLFLDVLLKHEAWQQRATNHLPVLVWIHGGGFDVGWKDASGAGHGLVSRSTQYEKDGIILVSINYRLGLFGWMNGNGVQSNVGLLDQRFALRWVQEYIHLFGGDASRITVLGESAGASSIEAHITAYGGSKSSAPFQGAIAQSPYFLPTYPFPNSYVDAILRFGNISSLAALRNMSSSDLQTLNTHLIGNSTPFGSLTFGIAPDGDYVPSLPSRLLAQGRFDGTVWVMTGHNQDEGSRLVPNTLLTNDTVYRDYFKSLIAPLQSDHEAAHQIFDVLYPPVFDGSQGYTNQTERNNLTIADAAFVCNARALDDAPFIFPTYAYEWSVPPAVHGADLAYTFYDFGDVPGVNTTLAEVLQGYILGFTANSNPNSAGLPYFPFAKGNGLVLSIGTDFIGPRPDERGVKRVGERCRYWQKAPYLTRYH